MNNIVQDLEPLKDRLRNHSLYNSIKDSSVVKVLPSDIFCNTYIKERCTIIFKGDSFYRDYDHLNSFGNELLISDLIDNLIENLKK